MMKVQRQKSRVYVRIILYKNGEVVNKYSSTIRTRLNDFVQGERGTYGRGICRVVYDSRNNVWNEFDFLSGEDFSNKIKDDLDINLLRWIAGSAWDTK